MVVNQDVIVKIIYYNINVLLVLIINNVFGMEYNVLKNVMDIQLKQLILINVN